jgi:hypothetical protein
MSPRTRPQVFCQHCRFFLGARRPGWRRCLHPHARLTVASATEQLQSWKTPQQRNRHNDCPDFRPWRWWERLVMDDPATLAVSGLLGCVLLLVWWTSTGR